MTVGDLGTAAAAAAAFLLVLAATLGMSHRTATPAAICAAIGCAALIVLGLAAMFGPVISIRMGDVLGFSPIDVRFDPLAGTFLLALGSVGVAASIFAIGYHGAGRSVGERAASGSTEEGSITFKATIESDSVSWSGI